MAFIYGLITLIIIVVVLVTSWYLIGVLTILVIRRELSWDIDNIVVGFLTSLFIANCVLFVVGILKMGGAAIG